MGPPAPEASGSGRRPFAPLALAIGLVAVVGLSAAAVVVLSRDDGEEAQPSAEPVTSTSSAGPEDAEDDGDTESDSLGSASDTELDLVLDDEGLGDLAFGAPADATVTALTEALGPPDFDTGEDLDNYCPGGDLFRAVRWGPLVVLINFGSITQTPSRVDPFFWGWSYATFAGYTGEGIEDIADTLQLASPSGIGLDSTGADIERQATGWEVYEGDPFGFPPPSYSADGLYIVMDANGPQGRVNSLNAGGACGE